MKRVDWLNEISNEELINTDPWRVLTHPLARGFLIQSARPILENYSSHGWCFEADDLLNDIYYAVFADVRPLLITCAKTVANTERDVFIYGSLRRLVRRKIANQVFGRIRPNVCVPLFVCDVEHDSDTEDDFPTSSLDSFAAQMVADLDNSRSYQPQFLSESEPVEDESIKSLDRLIEQFRPYLSVREIQVVRFLLLSQNDRSLAALAIGTTQKMISRYRRSAQDKMKAVLIDLGWEADEIMQLLGKCELASADQEDV